ncbi:hypothetical protein BH10PSE13_BH10PSE13_21860 [soil metagenome]
MTHRNIALLDGAQAGLRRRASVVLNLFQGPSRGNSQAQPHKFRMTDVGFGG